MDQHLEPHQRATTPHDHSAHENRNIHSSARSNSSDQPTESHPNSAPASVNPEYEDEEDTIDSSNLDGDTAADRPSSKWDSAVLDTWLYELCALVFSFACFIAIIAVLWAYDQKSTPTMWQGLTLNTIVSILATASKSSLIFVVGDAIGQLKWVTFKRTFRPLSQAQAYDNASRGPLGAFLIIFQDRGQSLVTIGAFITVLALLFDPFVQQVITYPLRETPGDRNSAIAKRSIDMNFRASDLELLQALNAAYWTSDFALDPLCPSGNCTWPSFVSVGFCSKCEDITTGSSLVNCTDFNLDEFDKTGYQGEASAACNVSIPQGAWSSSPISLVDWTMSIPKDVIWNVFEFGEIYDDDMKRVLPNETFLGIKNPLYVFAHAALSFPFQNTTIDVGAYPNKGLKVQKVTQCALSLCAREYEISVSRGVSSTRVHDPDFGVSSYRWNENDLVTCWSPGAVGSRQLTDRRETSERISYDTTNVTGTERCLVLGPGGLVGTKIELEGSYQSLFWKVAKDQWFQRLGQEVFSSQFVEQILGIGLDRVMENMAASLTKLGLTKSPDTVTGTMLISESYVHVHWIWLLLPALLLGLGVLFLLSTIFVSKKHKTGIWKASILPLLYHGLDDHSINMDDQYATLSEMERSSKAINVKLKHSYTRGGLVFGKKDDDHHSIM